jgi:hypothetical protein
MAAHLLAAQFPKPWPRLCRIRQTHVSKFVNVVLSEVPGLVVYMPHPDALVQVLLWPPNNDTGPACVTHCSPCAHPYAARKTRLPSLRCSCNTPPRSTASASSSPPARCARSSWRRGQRYAIVTTLSRITTSCTPQMLVGKAIAVEAGTYQLPPCACAGAIGVVTCPVSTSALMALGPRLLCVVMDEDDRRTQNNRVLCTFPKACSGRIASIIATLMPHTSAAIKSN